MDRPPSVPLHLTSLAILGPDNAPLFVHAFTGKEDEMRAYHLAHAAVDVIEERIVMMSTPSRPADSYLGLLFCMEDMAFYGFQTTTKLRLVLSVALVDAAIKDSDVVSIFRAVHNLMLRVISNPFLSLPSSFKAKPAPPYRHTEESLAGLPPKVPAKDGEPEPEPEPKATATATATAEGEEADGERVAEGADGGDKVKGEEEGEREKGDKGAKEEAKVEGEERRERRWRNEPIPEDRMFRADPGDIRPEWFESTRFQQGIAGLGTLLNGRA